MASVVVLHVPPDDRLAAPAPARRVAVGGPLVLLVHLREPLLGRLLLVGVVTQHPAARAVHTPAPQPTAAARAGDEVID